MPEKHSRLTAKGQYFWWTERLWLLARDLPVITILLEDIKEFEANCWFSKLEDATCKAVAKHAKRIVDADLSYPIILSSEGFLMDGGHRISKAWLNGFAEIKAVRFEIDPEPDWIETVA
jgi:hypothetical protein